MRKKTGLALILIALMLSLTTTAIITNSNSPYGIPALTLNLQQSSQKATMITWGNEIQANTNYSLNQIYPSVCYFPDGSGFVVAWRGDQNKGDQNIYVKVFSSSGNNLTDDIRVNGWTSNVQDFPAVSCFPNGYFVVTWHSKNQDGDGNGVYAKVFNSTWDNVTDDIQVNGNVTGDQEFSSVCCFQDNSSFVVAWHSNQTGDYNVYAKVYQYNLDWENMTDDILLNSHITERQRCPSVCCRSDGSFVVAWHSYNQDGEDYGVYARLFNSTGGSLTNEIQVNTYNKSSQANPSVCCFSDGSFVVAWESFNQTGDDTYDVYARLFNSTGSNLTDEIQVNTNTTGYQWLSSVCCFSDGSFVVAWSSEYQDGNSFGVFAKLFNSNGGKLTGDVQVNNYTQDQQRNPSVCCFGSDSFVVVWMSLWQDSSGWGIYFRVGYVSPTPSVLPLLLAGLVVMQSGAGANTPLLVGLVLVVAVVAGVIIYWLWKRGI